MPTTNINGSYSKGTPKIHIAYRDYFTCRVTCTVIRPPTYDACAECCYEVRVPNFRVTSYTRCGYRSVAMAGYAMEARRARERERETGYVEGGAMVASEIRSEDTRGLENKNIHKKRKGSEFSGESVKEKDSFLVGMVAALTGSELVDGIFRDVHQVGKEIGEKVGKVCSVRVTRSGMVVIECVSESQRKKALKIREFMHVSMKCFPLGPVARKKGVMSDVPLSVDANAFLEVEGVCEARRMTRFRDGMKEETNCVCLTFEGELPTRVYLDYVCHRVRPYERAPLRCFCCQEYGHVAAVCAKEKICRRCGKDECDVVMKSGGKCSIEMEQVKCLHCEGNHETGAVQCPRRKKEKEVSKIREERGLSYAEAAKRWRWERDEERMEVHKEPEKRRDENNQICMDKKRFLAFIAMVINCAASLSGKTERIDMVLDAAKRFLDVVDVSGTEIDKILRDAFEPTQSLADE